MLLESYDTSRNETVIQKVSGSIPIGGNLLTNREL